MTPAGLFWVNPYPGLVPFEESDAGRFFGRDAEIEEILERLASRRLLAVIGVSGCGKSSLVRAGVKPILRVGAAESLPGRWRMHTITPGNAPLDALRSSLQASSNWPRSSFDLIKHAKDKLLPNEKLLMIVDQFEEIFAFRAQSLEKDAGNEAALFVNLLLNAVDQQEVPIYLLLVTRSDFLGECAHFRGFPEALNDCYYLVPRMTRAQQQDAIERPLEEQPTAIAPALVQQLLNDSAEDPDHLPVLQHLLKRLWESARERQFKTPIDIADYASVGTWREALDHDAGQIMERFPAERDNIRRLFQWITDRGAGERPIRRARPLSECAEISELQRRPLLEIVNAFQERGILKKSDLSDASLLDLSHESVMWQWKQLKEWIEEEAKRSAELRFFLQSAQNRVPLSGLALGTALARRAEWRKQKLLATRYLKESELAEANSWIEKSLKHHQRSWIFRWFGIPALMLMLFLAGLLVFVKERNSAQARELSAWSALSLGDDPQRSGLQAWGKQQAMVPTLEQSLHDALMRSPCLLTVSHQSGITGVAWSPDGTKLATASRDKTTSVWDASNGHHLLTLSGHRDTVMSVAWSPDGRRIATASSDSTAKVWDASTGSQLFSRQAHQAIVFGVAWSPDGSRLATAGDDNTAKVWDSITGVLLVPLRGHQGFVFAVAWSPDGNMLATASGDKTFRVWDAGSGKELYALSGHTEVVNGVAWSPDGSKIATVSDDNTAKVWNATSRRELLTLAGRQHGHQAAVTSVAWSSDGRKLTTASRDKTAKVWDAVTGAELLTLNGHQDSVNGVAWSPNGAELATASADHTAKVWDAAAGRELLSLLHRSSVIGVAWSPDGGKLASVGQDGGVKLWDATIDHELLTIRGEEGIGSLAWSPHGNKLAASTSSLFANVNQRKAVTIWDTATGHELLKLGDDTGPTSLEWSPDGRNLATAAIVSRDSTCSVKVWDSFTGRKLLVFPKLETSSAQAPSSSKAALIRWNSIKLSPDGGKVATAGGNNTAELWDASTGYPLLHPLSGHGDFVARVAWSPDGSKVATASYDSTAKVWEVATGRELLTLRGHRVSVTDVTWSPDGSKLATAGGDKTVRVWDSRAGRELLILRGHQTLVDSVAWSPDGKRLASGGNDGVIQIYAIDSTDLLHLIRSRITRELTRDESQKYLNIDHAPELPRVP